MKHYFELAICTIIINVGLWWIIGGIVFGPYVTLKASHLI